MKEGVEEDSETDSMAAKRIMAEPSDSSTVEDDEHITVSASKRARPNCDAFGEITYNKIDLKKPEGKLSDVHVVMSHILDGLLKLQEKSGIRWRIPHKKYGGHIDVVLKIPIHALVGDNEGLDKIIGHYTNRTKVAGVCCKCKVPRASKR
jgi:hypothetical protein